MVKIAVCDDSQESLNQTVEMLARYIKIRQAAGLEVCAFSSPFDLLESVESGNMYSLFILDIMMPGISGLQIARELRKMEIGASIIFISSERTYAYDAFEVGATQYLLKGFTEERFFSVLDTVCDFIRRERRRQILLQTKNGMHNVFCRNILYASGNKNYQEVTMRDGRVLEVRITGKKLADELTKSISFFRCGSSYIVNLFYVQSIQTDQIVMSDGFVIRLPRGVHSALKQSYLDFHAKINRV